MDLFKIAEANGPALKARLDEAKAARCPADALLIERFAQWVAEHGRISLNLRPWVLRSLLGGARHQTIYEWARERREVLDRQEDEILKENLREYYPRRAGFDTTFENAEDFRYGALNAGGLGPLQYGAFCCVLSSVFPETASPVAYLKDDSLNAYVAGDGTVDVDRIRTDVAAHGSRHTLAALKHAEAVPKTPEPGWPCLLCSKSQYIEAIFAQELSCQDVAEIRVAEDEYQRLRQLALDSFGHTLKEGDRALAEDFIQILRATKHGTVTLRRL